MPTRVRLALGGLGILTVAHVAQVTFVLVPRPGAGMLEKVATDVIVLGAALLCAWRARAVGRERAAWLCFAAGLGLWGLGDLYFAIASWDLAVVGMPSPADAGYLGLYPFLFAGLALLLRARGGGDGRRLWVDGALGALALTALAATLLYGPLLDALHGPAAEVAVDLARPLADLLLLGLVGGAVAMTGRRPCGASAWIAAGIALFVVTDALHLYTDAVRSHGAGLFLDAGWPIAALMLAYAAWLPAPPATAGAGGGRWTIALPPGLGAICLALLVYDHFAEVNLLAIALATTALLAVLGRLAMTIADNARMLRESRHEALTDGLTGLHNRRALLTDVARALESETPMVLGLFDLDGFKLYNDTFGHAAGDALLVRLGAALERSLRGDGRAYRLGGDEFCILAAAGDGPVAATVADAGAALTEHGAAFAVGCSYGTVLLPHEAAAPALALALADRRMYAEKHSRRPSAQNQSKAVLRQALTERHPDLEPHVNTVADLADAVARRLGMPEPEVADVRLAAELHDVGKVAVPARILDKQGPLDEAEWRFMRRHTLIGERIVAAAPALGSVARIVRSSHERVDGGGYPDGLRGSQIPLAARIVFACDAFEAMTCDRPYSGAMPEADALAELRRCAGSQFEPVVVEALCGVIGERRSAAARPAAAPVSRPRSAVSRDL